METIGEELVVQKFVCGEDGANRDAEVHELAAEESKGVPVVLVVNVLLEVSQHPAHLLLGVVNHATRCT